MFEMFDWFKKSKQADMWQPKVTDFSGDLNIFFDNFKKEVGIDFTKKYDIMVQKLKNYCIVNDLCSFEEFEQLYKTNSDFKQKTIDYLTVNETYFYREFEQIKEIVNFMKNKSFSKILIAPSSSGEEPYSVAIAAIEEGIGKNNFTIDAIDINKSVIEIAKEGIYNQRSVHRLESLLVDKYFTQYNDKVMIKDFIKENINFSVCNIFDGCFDGFKNYDILISRNMLIYFDEDTKIKAIRKFKEKLKNDGKLFFGHADNVQKLLNS